MDRFLDAESNGGGTEYIGTPVVYTCRIPISWDTGRKRNIYYNATRSELSPRNNLYIFKISPVLLVF